MTTTETTSTSAATTELAPYIFFGGRCEEALKFYQTVFGGEFEIKRNSDTPFAAQMPENWRDKVMHASFTAPGVTFMSSDGREERTIDPEAGNISLALSFTDVARGKAVFDALAAGGKVKMPLEDATWGGKFGMLDDRFGNEWLITTP